MSKGSWFIMCLFSLLGTYAHAQQSSYTLPSTGCLNQNLSIINSSVNADTFEWDFCLDDMRTLNSSTNVLTITGLNGAFGYKLVQDNGLWFGFVTSVNNNKLFRLEFGNSPLNYPNVVDMGTLGGVLNLPEGIDLIKSNGSWYGFVGSLDFSSSSQGILKLDFGSSLLNTPVVSNLGNFGINSRLRNVKIVQEGNNNILILVNYNGNGLVLVRFNSSFSNTPATGDIVDTGPLSGASLPIGIDLTIRGTERIALLTSLNNSLIIQLNFGFSIFTVPVVEAQYALPGVVRPYQVKLVNEGGNFFASISNESNIVQIIDFKDMNIANVPSPVSHSTLPILIGLESVRWKGMSILQGTGNGDNRVHQMVFQSNCGANADYSTEPIPKGISYGLSGVKRTELRAFNSTSDLLSIQSESISISGIASPDISITTDNVTCVNSTVSFTSSSVAGGISTYQWDFGDSNGSSDPIASHSYTVAGDFESTLTITGLNGCKNLADKTITIYNAPVADFTLVSPAQLCTNQQYLLTNLSTFDPLSNTSWQWRVNGVFVSSQKDFTVTFSSTTSQDIRLMAILPGCQSEKIKTIASVIPGPAVIFSAADNCLGTMVSFSNSTVGADAGYVWDFGDATSSTQPVPSHDYASAGSYQVKLTASNSAGCSNFIIQSLRIYSTPNPDFSVGLPPFACSNTATPFQNNTPALSDSDIAGWSWNFGDGLGGSSQQNPSHVYSVANNYNVVLTAISNKGCLGVVTKSISIASSPIADFTVGPSCLNLGTKFTDTSNGSVQTRAWQIASATFSVPNPTYTFTSPGDFSATLTVTGANSCSTFKTKTVRVSVPPVLDFAASNLCSGKVTRFTDITSSPQDAIVGWNWNFAGNSTTVNPADNVFATAGTQNVKMTTTHLSGCKYTLSKNVLVNTSPVADFTATPDRGSAPLIVQFTNTSQFASNYLWRFYDKVLATSTQNSPSHTFTSLGNYSAELTATSAQGCADVKTVPIIVLVPAIDLALTDFTLTPDASTGKLKGVVTILNKSNIPLLSTEIGFILADKAVVNETFAINLNPGQSVSKTLSFTISPNQFDFNFLCAQINSEKDIEQSNNKRCINLEKNDYFFNPYPNPTSGPLHVDWISVVPETARIIIYDAMGRKSYEWETQSAVGLNQSDLDVAFLSAGLYFLSIETPGSKKTSRFFRQ